ncbi:COPII coat Sec23p-Sfb3p heterodimer component [Saxophila tyrrhenica]|uniref:COPII coat Sec23p-Sfb3p heterodimer component n=1 Tax=Saxophila tyrrhenica TaxID=1690608 RepID=A0AAV9P6X1_9PEZI|nr:COPII coat Sec23p-Sfb3p heterodimer component [Saxophila tyrrhenica]
MQQGYEQYGGQYGGQYGQQQQGDLSQQMGQMSLDGAAPQQTRKKKNRHAYHQLEQPAATGGGQFLNGGVSGQPQPGTSPGQAVTGAAPWQQQASQPWQSQPGTPGLGQPMQPMGTPISMSAVGGPQQGGMGGGQGKVNPDQIPSVPLSRDLPADYYKSNMYPTMEQRLPPPATTPFIAYDQGNASPKHARLTMNCIPASHEQLNATSLPLGLVMQPLARPAEGEQAIPVLDFGEAGPPRCRRCRAYINPFMIFSNGGNRMTCNLCGHPNEVPAEYFAPTDPSGMRVDRAQRPELLLGTCEYLVPKEYWSKEPVGMRYLFLIDVSAEACNRGFVQGMCDGILAALYGNESSEEQANGDEEGEASTKPSKVPAGAKVGFATFDREVHFYNVAPSQSGPQQLVMSDLEEPFTTISPEYLFVDAAESKANITKLLGSIPQMFFNIKHAEPALLPSLQAALAALEVSGGKIVCSLGSLPTYGPGKLQMRDKSQMSNDDNELSRTLLKTEHQGFRKMQADLVKAGVGVDFFLAAPSGGYLDISTIGFVAEKTGGETFYYPNWTYPRDLLRLEKELSHTVQREQGYAALMKVRCSNGLQVSHYSGNFTQHTFGADLELASVTEDSGMCVTFTYDGKLDTKFDAYFQSALLYTTQSGQRRVRCSNVVAQVNESARESMKLVDQDAVIGILAKESASKIADKPLKDIRQQLQDKMTDILAGYRKHFSGSHPPGQLVLPENLKEFSMYVLGLMKSRALKGGKEPPDRRVNEIRMLKGMGPAELSLYLYPRMIALHGLEPEEGFADENGHLRVPHAVRASFSQIEEGGAYLVDNGQILLLWLHAQVSPNLLEDLFGEGFDELSKLDPNLSALPVLETHLNAQVRNILLSMETNRGSKGLSIQLARQGLDGAEFEFARLLYEDRNGEASSYVDWLVMLHRGVSMELNGQRNKGGEDGSSSIANTISGLTHNVPYFN